MDCLVTLNLGGYLQPNSRASFLSASRRWRADYVEVTTPYREDLNPCYTKPTVFSRLKHYDRIAYFDADILIRSDAPTPFEMVSPGVLCAVKDISDSRFPIGSPVREVIQNEAHIPWHSVLERQFAKGVSISSFVDRFFNAGFLLADPVSCGPIFDFVVANIPAAGSDLVNQGRYEQALINYAALSLGKVKLVDETWNYISPDLSTWRMDTWVYHFTGLDSHFLKEQLDHFPWQLD